MRSAFRRLPEPSLRLRLLLALVALAAVGLAAVGLVSYRALESYLLDRVDTQLEAAIGPTARALADELDEAERESLGLPDDDPLGGRFGGAPFGRGGAEPGPGPGGAPESQLPPGTFGQLRDAEGTAIVGVLFGFETDLPRPALPADLETGPVRAPPEPITSGSREGDSTDFRALSVAGPGETTMVVAVPLSETQATLDRLAVIAVVVSAAVLASLAALAWWLIGVGLRPLRRMGEVAGQIAAGDLSRRVGPANQRTEVGRLGISLNAMLAQIERAFAEREAGEARLRQFLADASHELRTPLAAIRGYAELHRLGANREGEEVDRAMGRIEAESSRMGGLVDDLLTLARVDEVREPVRDRVALRDLLAGCCEDARATARDREIVLRAEHEVATEGDADQLRRVFANLLRNAIVHTPDGTPVEVELERRDDAAVARVRDHGPGLPGGGEEVFERFWRGSSARGRDDGGAGLGLAIVAALVGANDGHVEAGEAEGGGAVFTVSLSAA